MIRRRIIRRSIIALLAVTAGLGAASAADAQQGSRSSADERTKMLLLLAVGLAGLR